MITQLPNNYIAVQVLEGAHTFSMYSNYQLRFYIPGDHTFHVRTLPPGKYTIVGMAKELPYEKKMEILGADHERYSLEALLVSKGCPYSTSLILKQDI